MTPISVSTAPTPTGSAPAVPSAPPSRRWWALAALALAQFLVVLDASIVNIAIPTLGADLGLGPGALAWVITAYVLPFGSLLLFGGRLADRFGHRRIFLIGTGSFIGASALAGLAVSGEMLLTARALQGASAALLAPASLALVTRLFTSTRDRARALGIWGAVAGAGSAAGVLLGGVLTAAFGWQAVFFVNLPVGVIVFVAVPFLIRRDLPGAGMRLDLAGAATVTGALVALVAGLTSAEQLGFANPVVLGLLGAAIVLGAAFVVVERRTAEPLLPLSTFANRSVSAGNVVMLLLGGAMVALFFALSVYLQEVMHLDSLGAGLTQLPLAIALVVVAGAVPPLVARFGVRPTLAVSLLVFAGGLAWLAAAPADAVFLVHVLGPTLLIGIGLGGAFVTATQLAVHGVEGGEAGLAGGLVNTSQQVGGALGMAVLATLAASRTESLAAGGATTEAALAGGFSLVYLGAAGLAVVAAVIALVLRGGVGAGTTR
ncbi:EmrB/QacA subfamily drug resistance transporter [Agromyces sp. 3263]|uniref:DHA2 family efflux MFS transporter permease subunit n=1 Tax=Agromyces sp. 3263 TaxID=2817750 RepID=UPI00285E7EFC|nr:DHA2 family efflux MFS transporter permease subunit [Agromyces sp. 3263]MDR6906190.1 EmrB/QacA subfamily drug resistance transporter [Agromyces sp. 3263]